MTIITAEELKARIEAGDIPLHQQALLWGMKKNVELVQWPDNIMHWKYISLK